MDRREAENETGQQVAGTEPPRDETGQDDCAEPQHERRQPDHELVFTGNTHPEEHHDRIERRFLRARDRPPQAWQAGRDLMRGFHGFVEPETLEQIREAQQEREYQQQRDGEARSVSRMSPLELTVRVSRGAVGFMDNGGRYSEPCACRALRQMCPATRSRPRRLC